jgi:hypothetical protein
MEKLRENTTSELPTKLTEGASVSSVSASWEGSVEEIVDPTPWLAETEADVPTWDASTVELIEWLGTAQFPKEPFYLAPWIRVGDPVKFCASLQADAQAGPAGPRARTGAFQSDLARLRTFCLRRIS